jgi:hypothetical protein
LGIILYWMGEYRSAVEALKQAEQHYDNGLGRAVLRASVTAIWKVFALVELGEFHDALACVDRGFQAGEERAIITAVPSLRRAVGSSRSERATATPPYRHSSGPSA